MPGITHNLDARFISADSMGAHNARIWPFRISTGIEPTSAPYGGYRAVAAASDCHAARL
jgi:hypothetical protein